MDKTRTITKTITKTITITITMTITPPPSASLVPGDKVEDYKIKKGIRRVADTRKTSLGD